MRRALAALVGVVALTLTGCSVSITANDAASTAPTLDASASASQAAVDTADFVTFCQLEAKGSLDFLSVLGDSAKDAIKDGIAQSISQQGLTGSDAQACTQAWVETLKGFGLTYDPVANTITGTLNVPASTASDGATDAASPAAS